MSLPLNQYNDPVFDRSRIVVRVFTFINFLLLCFLLFLTNKGVLDWKFFWYEYNQLKFLILMTANNYVFAFLVALFLFFSKIKMEIVGNYSQRMQDLKNNNVDANFWDSAGSSLGYSHIMGFVYGNLIFLLTPIIFGLLFVFSSLSGTLIVLSITFVAQCFLIPVVLAMWTFILWR